MSELISFLKDRRRYDDLMADPDFLPRAGMQPKPDPNVIGICRGVAYQRVADTMYVEPV